MNSLTFDDSNETHWPLLATASVTTLIGWTETLVSHSASCRMLTGVCVLFTTRVAFAVRVRPPPVPLTVSGKLPAAVLLTVLIVMVDDCGGVIGFGLKDADAPDGRPLTLSVTAELKLVAVELTV